MIPAVMVTFMMLVNGVGTDERMVGLCACEPESTEHLCAMATLAKVNTPVVVLIDKDRNTTVGNVKITCAVRVPR